MTAFRVDEPGRVADHLNSKVLAAARRGLLSAAVRLQAVIVTEIIPRENPPPVDLRVYAAGWQQRPEPIEGGWMIKNTAPHAPVIEGGARAENVRPGAAMIEALTAWVARKGLVPKSNKSGTLTEARGVAWAIARAMQKRGIFNRDGKGLRIAAKAAARAPAIAAEEVAREIRREGL